MFAGLLLSYLYDQYIKTTGISLGGDYILVSKQLFGMSLIGFIASVGLLAGPDIEKALRQNGIKFLILSFVVNFYGGCIYLLTESVGTYVF